MYIRRVPTRRLADEIYYSYRLVESRREGAQVRQRTLLNLVSRFDLPESEWSSLCARIEEPKLKAIYETLGVNLLPVGTKKRVE